MSIINHTTALYIRLSQEDDKDRESNSVTNQRSLLNDFVSKHPELSKTNILHFVDDGYSGTNFNRPAFNDMLEQVKKGKINCIVVKDFSRFGRNYIEVCTYLEQVFPFMGVRFLSVNDFFDSNDHQGTTAGLEVGFKALLHDLYSKDLGMKSKSGKLIKTKKGEHIAGTAPFGYVKSKTIKNAWEFDEQATITVRRIYNMVLEGMSVGDIARTLNAEDIPTPLKHRQNNGTIDLVINNSVGGMSIWRKENVRRILRDERYTGKNITGKLVKSQYGNVKNKLQPKSEWLVIPNAHEAIVSQEDFDKVQSILGHCNVRTLERTNFNMFAGKVYCGHCGYSLRRYGERKSRPNSKLTPRYVCRASMELGEIRCLPEAVLESYIAEVLLEALQVEMALAFTARQQAEKHSKKLMSEYEKLSHELKILATEIERLKSNREKLFEKFTDGKLTKEQYITAKSELSVSIAKVEAEHESIITKLSNKEQSAKQNANYDILVPYANAKEVTAEMMVLVKRINVFADNRFEVVFTFSRSSSEKGKLQ